MLDDLYQGEILDHHHHPRNFGELTDADSVVSEHNQSCGDQITLYLKLKPQSQVIDKLSFTSTGCAISTATTSMLLEKLSGQPLSLIQSLTPQKLASLVGFTVNPSRQKCFTLSVRALQKAALALSQNPAQKAADTLRNGGVIIFPTDTVWGIGAWVGSLSGIKKLYQIKNRPNDKPTAILVEDFKQAQIYGKFSPTAQNLAHTHWPGALTIIVPAKTSVPGEIQSTSHSVGLRAPNHPLVQSLCGLLQGGIVAGSANFSGDPTPQNRVDIDQNLINKTDYLLEGQALGKKASTVVDTTTQPLRIIRQGEIKLQSQ